MRKPLFISLEQGCGAHTGPDISYYYFGSTMRSNYISQCYQTFSITCPSFISYTFLRSEYTMLVFMIFPMFLFIYIFARCGLKMNYAKQSHTLNLQKLEARIRILILSWLPIAEHIT